MKPRYIYNTSDIGYMDEEWIIKTTELVEEKVEEKTNNQDEQEELKKVQ